MIGVATAPAGVQRARTLLAGAASGRLSTGCRLLETTVTTVDLETADGRALVVRVPTGSAAMEGLGACRVATLTVTSPDSASVLRLVASFRMDRPDGSGVQTYRATVLSVRLADPHETVIDVEQFWRAAPDPLARDARRVLSHLHDVHGPELVAAARAHGHLADVVAARSVDSGGVELTTLGADGVGSLRLDVAGGPVDGVAQLMAALPVSCTCGV